MTARNMRIYPSTAGAVEGIIVPLAMTFQQIAVQLNELTEELKSSTSLSERRALLKRFRELLGRSRQTEREASCSKWHRGWKKLNPADRPQKQNCREV
jgi:hypothetical protein